MKGEISDKQLDQVMRQIVLDASLDEETVQDIANSPKSWWAVQRSIAGVDTLSAPWPPSWAWRRFLTIAIPAFSAIALVIGYFANVNVQPTFETGTAQIVQGDPAAAGQIVANDERPEVINPEIPVRRISTRRGNAATANIPASSKRVSGSKTIIAKRSQKDEVKTDFISLTYAGVPESGHVVRVKVPGSMMINLGVVSSLERPTNLVDAEVVLGDDGQTHAIRFIRQ